MDASWPSVRMSSQAVGVGGHDRLSCRQRFERRQRRPLPERGKHGDVERRERARGIAAKAGEDEAFPEPEARGLRLEIRAQRPFADEHESGAGPRGDNARRGVHQEGVAFRLVQPGDAADGEIVRGEASSWRAAAISSVLRGRLNSSSGTPR
jgi:hypothetical protein